VRTRLFIIAVSIIILSIITTYNLLNNPITVFKDGTTVGYINLSGKTLTEGLVLIESRQKTPIYLNIESTSRAVTLEEMGITFNMDEVLKATKTCRFRSPRLFCAVTSNEPLHKDETILIDNAKLDAFLNGLLAELQPLSKNTIISFSDYSFYAPGPNAQITFDLAGFKSKENIYNLIHDQDVKVHLALNVQDEAVGQKAQTQTLIANIVKPLLIKYGRNPIYIPTDILKKVIASKEQDGKSHGYIDAIEIGNYLDSIRSKYEKDDVKILRQESIIAIQNALLFRTTDYKINTAVVLPIEGNSNTNGELHDVYLEVNKAQQRLYRFEHGKLVKTYIVSTGLTWETPAGEYKVLGKQKMAISYFGNWYMPYYLPIGLINNQYRFGFHAIPYHIDGNGSIYSRDENTMGSPATGGCIQLTMEEAKELFEWAQVGTPVYIYEN
jgi:lipoprotein-anchoring transpeptidase ErfK/SrfK